MSDRKSYLEHLAEQDQKLAQETESTAKSIEQRYQQLGLTQLLIPEALTSLEYRLGEKYLDLKDSGQDLRRIPSRNVFQVYDAVKDLDPEVTEEYFSLLAQVKKKPFRVKDPWIKSIIYKSSQSLDYPSDGVFVTTILSGGTAGAIAGGSVAGPPGGILGFVAGVICACATVAGIGKIHTKMDGYYSRTYRFNQPVIDYLEKVSALNLTAQKLQAEVADLEDLSTAEIHQLENKFGGREGVLQRMDKAKKEVEQVRTYTSTILGTVGVNIPQLNADYLTHGQQKKQDRKEIFSPELEIDEDKIKQELSANDLDQKIQLLRSAQKQQLKN